MQATHTAALRGPPARNSSSAGLRFESRGPLWAPIGSPEHLVRANADSRYIEIVHNDEGNPMSSTPEPKHIAGHHRDTLLQIFQHPTSHNIEWHDVISLLETVGSIEERHDDMFVFRIGEEREVLRRPKAKDIDAQQIVDLRRMLTSAGYDTVVADLESKGKED